MNLKEQTRKLREQLLEILGTTNGLPDSDITRLLEKQNIEAVDKIIALFQLQTPQPDEVKPEVNPKDISHAIFRATHERGWFHEKDALDILSKYTITAK